MGLPAQQGSKRGFCAFTLDGIQLFVFEQRRRQRFCLYREADVPQPVRHDDLTLDEVEEILSTWKLRGPHGADVAGSIFRRERSKHAPHENSSLSLAVLGLSLEIALRPNRELHCPSP
jgi:hypothetical protein